MKKVGILTFHRAHNYGAVLQCYALQEVLKKIGYIVNVIDYRQPYIESSCTPFSRLTLIKNLKKPIFLFRYVYKIRDRIRSQKIYSNFVSRYLQTTKSSKTKIPSNLDLYMIGSDQMWGIHCTNGLDPIYFGDFDRKEGSKVVGYAISTNKASLDSIGSQMLKRYAKNFDVISFREEGIKKRYEQLTNDKKSRVDVDPTLLTDIEDWSILINDKWRNRNYVLVSMVRYNNHNKDIKIKAREFAESMNCELIDISDLNNCSPSDFVSLFYYAKYVITTSFHATSFSLIFEKPLYSVKLGDGHDERYSNILETLGAEEMLVNVDFEPKLVNFDYAKITSNRLDLRNKSIKYLENL